MKKINKKEYAFEEDTEKELEKIGVKHSEMLNTYIYKTPSYSLVIWLTPLKDKPHFSIEINVDSYDQIDIKKAINSARNLSVKMANIVRKEYEQK